MLNLIRFNSYNVLFVIALCAATIGFCTCPNSLYLSQRSLTQGTWEKGQRGSVPGGNLAVIGAIDPIDGEKQYVCRGKFDDAMIPGRLLPTEGNCYVIRWEKMHTFSEYEVLVNRDGYNLDWVDYANGEFADGTVVGGYATGWPMLICRAWHRGRQGVWRWVNGKLDPEPGYEACYIPYGNHISYKKYQVLRNKLT